MLKMAITGAALIATAAIAQAPTNAPQRSGPQNDPDEVVCITERVTGSRLSSRRVCRTRTEWAEHRAETRKVVERVQFYKPTTGE
jgi:hypothetical protein